MAVLVKHAALESVESNLDFETLKKLLLLRTLLILLLRFIRVYTYGFAM